MGHYFVVKDTESSRVKHQDGFSVSSTADPTQNQSIVLGHNNCFLRCRRQKNLYFLINHSITLYLCYLKR